MIFTDSTITTRRNHGVECLAETVYKNTVKELYALQYVKHNVDEKLLLLIYVLESWLNNRGAANTITEKQMTIIMDKIITVQGCECNKLDEEGTLSETTISYLATEDFQFITTENGSLILL